MPLVTAEFLDHVTELHGPDEIDTAKDPLLDPGIDCVVVRNLVTEDEAAELFPPELPNTTKKSFNIMQADSFYPKLLEFAPNLETLDDFANEHWEELSFIGSALKARSRARYFVDHGSEPHNDTVQIRSYGIPISYFGPISWSLGLHGGATLSFNRLPSTVFDFKNGELHVRAKLNLPDLDDALHLHRHPDKPVSKVRQGIGDLLLWVSPQTVHSIDITKSPRVSMIGYQTQGAPTNQ